MLHRDNPLRHRGQVWPWVAGMSVIVVVIYLIASNGRLGGEFVVAMFSGIMGTAFFIHRGHREDARFMKELFEYFNHRYDDQNNNLQLILRGTNELSEDDELAFVDYFNLCAEEWVFKEAGYIYGPVWEAWENGMRQFGRDPRIVALWKQEMKTKSYYGFEFPIDRN